MHRREALQRVAVILGGTIIGAEAFLSGCKPASKKTSREFAQEDVAYLDEIADTIIPTTSTPGAKAAKVGSFMTIMVNDCYDDDDQRVFHEGMEEVNKESKKKFDVEFMKATPQQRHELLVAIDGQAKEYKKKKELFDSEENKKLDTAEAKGEKYEKEKMNPHYFTLMKQLTLLGYFTSEIGQTQALNYVPVPGRYDPCMDYQKGQKSFV